MLIFSSVFLMLPTLKINIEIDMHQVSGKRISFISSEKFTQKVCNNNLIFISLIQISITAKSAHY